MSWIKANKAMEGLDLSNSSLRKFGITMAVALCAIALIMFFKGSRFTPVATCLSAAFLILGLSAPKTLKQFYVSWMALAKALGWVNTRLILMLVFYAVFTPIGLCMRLFGRDPLDRKVEKTRQSYWKKKESGQPSRARYERQF